MLNKKNIRILIAVNNELTRYYIATFMEEAGYSTLMAANGNDAIQIIKYQNVACAFLDLHLTNINGYEILQYLDNSKISLPCIMVFTEKDRHAETGCRELGIKHFIYRPIGDPVEMIKKVENLLTYS
ncbi:MAG: response regulator [Bacteroidales bacterium]|nr:response regulator [Bacteroidales bacterium]